MMEALAVEMGDGWKELIGRGMKDETVDT